MIFLMPIYFIIALVIIYKLMKKYPSKHKIGQFLLLSFLFYLPVGWDVILGRAYFNYLCHKDGGIHIYQTVELGDEYWNEGGSPKFYTEKGAFDSSIFNGRYIFEAKDDRYTKKRPFRTIQYAEKVVDTETGQILGEWFKYELLGGWVLNTWQPFGAGRTGGSACHFTRDTPDNPTTREVNLVTPIGIINTDYSKFTSYIFLRKNIEIKQGEQ